MKIGYCIITYNRAKYIGHHIRTLLKQTRLPDVMVIVDNLSDDPDIVGILSDAKENGFHIICPDQRVGVDKAFNIGSQYLYDSGCDLILYAEDAIYLHPSCIAEIEKTFNLHSSIGVASPSLRRGMPELMTFSIPLDFVECFNQGKITEIDNSLSDIFNNQLPIAVAVVTADVLWCVRRKVIDSIGYRDDSFVGGWNTNTEYSARAREVGYSTVVVHKAIILHFPSGPITLEKQTRMADGIRATIQKYGSDKAFEEYVYRHFAKDIYNN